MSEHSVTVRAAQPGDVAAMHAFVHELAEYEHAAHKVVGTAAMLHDSLFPSDSAPAVWARVAVQGSTQTLCGMAIWHLNYSTWEARHGIYVEDIYVSGPARRWGVGSKLLSGLAQICVDRGYPRLQLSVLDWNEPAIDFYRRLGGEATPEWIGYRFGWDEIETLAGR